MLNTTNNKQKTLNKFKAIIILAMGLIIANEKAQAQTTWLPLDTVSIDSVSNVVVSYYEDSNCMGDSTVILKIENNSLQSVTVIWSLWTGALPKTIDLLPGEIREGACAQTSDQVKVSIPAGLTVLNMNPIINVQ